MDDDDAMLDVNLDQGSAMQELEELNAAGGTDPLEFQDLGVGGGLGSGRDALLGDDEDDAETASLLEQGEAGAAAGSAGAASVFSVAYYRKYFDVRTKQVLGRLARAVDPRSAKFFTDEDGRPDLYGPFWISTTLIFLMAATGNFARYLTSDDLEVHNDFSKVTVAASLLYSVVTAVPVLVWLFLRRIGQEKGLVEIICLYGYSLTVFVPACVVCVVPLEILRWLVTAASCAISSRFLLRNVWNYFALTDESRGPGYLLLGLMVVVQLGISLMLKLYFFSTTTAE